MPRTFRIEKLEYPILSSCSHRLIYMGGSTDIPGEVASLLVEHQPAPNIYRVEGGLLKWMGSASNIPREVAEEIEGWARPRSVP